MTSIIDLLPIILIAVVIIVILVIFLPKLFQQKRAMPTVEELTRGHDVDTLWKALNIQLVKLHELGQYKEATKIAEESLKSVKDIYGSDHIQTAMLTNNLAALYRGQARFIEAEPLFKEAIVIWEKHLGKESNEVASGLNNLADVYKLQKKYPDAESLYKNSLEIFEKNLGKEDINVAVVMENLADLYKNTGNTSKATIMDERARLIRAKST